MSDETLAQSAFVARALKWFQFVTPLFDLQKWFECLGRISVRPRFKPSIIKIRAIKRSDDLSADLKRSFRKLSETSV